jgi:ubiquinone/menaquinone biosynthesis C-methylase UbiE
MRFGRKQIAENHRRLEERDRLYRLHGYDSLKAVRFVLRHAGSLTGRVLEIGTGKGRFLVQLAGRATRVVTIDPDAREQRFARMNAAHAGVTRRVRFCVADGAALPFADASFDAVASMNALHHIRCLRGVLDEILRVIKPGGKIVLADFDASGFRIFDRIHRQEGRTHEQFPYSWHDIIARLRKAGLPARSQRGEHTALVVCRSLPASHRSRN